MKERERKAFRQFRLGALGEIMQLQNMAVGLQSDAAVSPWLGAIRGAAEAGLGGLVGELFTPGQELREVPTGTAIPTPPPAATPPATPTPGRREPERRGGGYEGLPLS